MCYRYYCTHIQNWDWTYSIIDKLLKWYSVFAAHSHYVRMRPTVYVMHEGNVLCFDVLWFVVCCDLLVVCFCRTFARTNTIIYRLCCVFCFVIAPNISVYCIYKCFDSTKLYGNQMLFCRIEAFSRACFFFLIAVAKNIISNMHVFRCFDSCKQITFQSHFNRIVWCLSCRLQSMAHAFFKME